MKTRAQRLLRITAQQLRAFEATARLGGVTAAAAELHVSQPTISVQLKQLAQTIGEPVFQLGGRQLQLTQVGALLQHTTAELLGCWERFEAQRAQLHGLVTGQLRIAAVTTTEYFVPDLLGPFAAAYPGIEIALAIENRDGVVARLARGGDDLAVMMMPPADLPLVQEPFYDNPLVVVGPATGAAGSRRLRLRDLAQARWLMREPGSGTRLATEAHFQAQGFRPRVAMSLGSNEAIKHAVAAGLGIAVLSAFAVRAGPGTLVESDYGALRILNVAGFPLRRRWFAVWRSDRPQSLAAQRFVAFLRETAAGAA